MTRIHVISVPRERDDLVLRWLADRMANIPFARISNREGVTRATVRSTCEKVKHDDLAFSGEPAPEVLRWYR